MEIKWEDNSEIRVTLQNGSVVVAANSAGLRSLAKIMETLAEQGGHLHLDEYNSLEDGSTELIIDNTDR